MNRKLTTLVAAGTAVALRSRLGARRCKARSWDVVGIALNKSGYLSQSPMAVAFG